MFSGRLEQRYMPQLQQWIGRGPVTFSLLYAITRDGCNATTFHQRCDKKGPTITVLYNTQGCVFGGYTSASWQSNNQWVHNQESFLFQLQNKAVDQPQMFFFGNKPVPNKAMFGEVETNQLIMFPIQECSKAIFCHRNYGPIFGEDLTTFKGEVINQGGHFQLNGRVNMGKSYNISLNRQLCNFNLTVVELEVYQVLDGEGLKGARAPVSEAILPWRKTKDWNEKLLDELMEDIEAFKPLADLRTREARILMVGPVGSGKSSFFNTIDSIFRGRVTQRASSGSAEQSLTTSYTAYKVRVRSGAPLNFRLCDTRGLEENQGLDVIECNYLLDGNVPNNYQFNPAKPITPKTPGFKTSPSQDDMIQCGVFVLDSTTLDVLSPKIFDKMKGIRNLMNEKGIPQVILLTKVDKLSEEVALDLSNAYRSPAVEKSVEKAAHLLGLPRANVLPVKNYENELELEEKINILALLSLRQILRHAEDCMENALDRKLDDGHEMEYLREKLEK